MDFVHSWIMIYIYIYILYLRAEDFKKWNCCCQYQHKSKKLKQKWKILLKEKNIFSLYLSIVLLTHKINSFEEKKKNILDIIDVLSQQITICKVQFQFFFVSHKKNKQQNFYNQILLFSFSQTCKTVSLILKILWVLTTNSTTWKFHFSLFKMRKWLKSNACL